MLTPGLVTTLLTALGPAPAHACGGFFCSADPIDQAGEDIVFAVDEALGEVTMHVQIAYTGSAEEFAWIVPVSENPEILLSTDRLFQELNWRTQPRFFLEYKEVFDCSYDGRYYGYPEAADASDDGGSSTLDTGSAAPGTVNVVSQQRVGPYDTVVLQAERAEGLLDWLQKENYLLPDELDPVLAPYIADGAYFVALKLAKDSDVGELAPLALQYSGSMASVPIQLTSIAATEDMRLRAYVLGEHRAVPESYLHVKVDDLVVDWFRGGANWEDAITIAADEANGHAFATDFSGPTSTLAGALYEEGRFDIDALAAAPDPYRFFDELRRQGFAGDSTMLALFRRYLPMPEALVKDGLSEQDFYNCLECFQKYVDQIDFDAAKFAAAIDEAIVTPLRQSQALIDAHPHLTRMTSSVSPVEMTLDPTFVFNADMEQTVALERDATLEIICGNGGSWSASPRRLVLDDGRSYNLPSFEWFWENDTTEYEYLSSLFKAYALIIEDTTDQGEPVVLYDGTAAAVEAAEAFNAQNRIGEGGEPAGCGCQHSGPAGAAFALLGLTALTLRRRKA